jgi:HAT1-interacting factor 1
VELNGPGIDMKEALYGPDALAGINPMGGILGATLGEAPADAAARLEEAKKTATDVSGLIRKKAKLTPSELPASTNGTNGKRKLEEETVGGEANKKAKVNGSKQAKVEDVPEE